MKNVKIVVVGAGSASFGRGTIADLMASEELRELDTTIVLVDTDAEKLRVMYEFAKRMKDYYGVETGLEATTDRLEALPGTSYVITAVARRRMELWEQDFRVPLAFGFRHINGENGGPGAAFHALRSFHLMIPICQDMERLCPDALLLNFTNPESRVCLAVEKLTKIRAVGLCHGAFGTLATVARVLEKPQDEIDMTIAGINHFHWVLEMCDRETGDDLYPLFRERMAGPERYIDDLSQRMFELFGLLPFPAASHIGEYVSYAYELFWPHGRDGRKIASEVAEPAPSWADRIRRVADGGGEMTEELARPSAELAVPIILDIELDRKRRELSVNIPNDGFAISNLPEDGLVEIPAMVDAEGVHPVEVGPLPEAIAAMCRTQIAIQNLLVEAYKERSKYYLLQALLVDPLVDSIERAEKMMARLLEIEADFLPEFR